MQQPVAEIRETHVPPPLPKAPLREHLDLPDGAEPESEYRHLWLGISLSLVLHLILVLVLAIWKFFEPPTEPGIVINSALVEQQPADQMVDPMSVEVGDIELEEPIEQEQAALVDPALFLNTPSNPPDLPFQTAAIGAAVGQGTTVGGGGSGDGVGFFGARGSGESFIFIVDCSGSMRGPRFERTRAELIRAVNALKPNQRFFIFFYSSQTHAMFNRPSSKSMVVATDKMRRQAIDWIYDRHADGGTQPEDAFRRALAMRPDVIFFLTDGEIPKSTRRTVRESNRRVTSVHTMAFQSRAGEDILRGIARDNNGVYRYID